MSVTDDEILTNYSRKIEQEPSNPVAHYNRGYIYMTLKLYENALEDFSNAIEIDPVFREAYGYRGLLCILNWVEKRRPVRILTKP